MNLPIAFASKEDGKPFVTHNPELFRLALNQLPDGKYKLEVKKCHKKASTYQFGYLYGVVYPVMLQGIIDTGEDAYKTIEDLDTWCKYKWANSDILDIDTGNILHLPMNKSEFKTIDEMAYCNKLKQWCSDNLDLHIPDPDTDWKQKKNLNNIKKI